MIRMLYVCTCLVLFIVILYNLSC